MSGWLDMATLTLPRSRISLPEPDMPELRMEIIPGLLAASTWSTLGTALSTLAMSTWVTEVPTSRRRAWPAVPVTTISSSPSASFWSSKSTSTGWLSWTVTRCSITP